MKDEDETEGRRRKPKPSEYKSEQENCCVEGRQTARKSSEPAVCATAYQPFICTARTQSSSTLITSDCPRRLCHDRTLSCRSSSSSAAAATSALDE